MHAPRPPEPIARTTGAVGAALPEFISQAQPAALPAHQAMGTRIGEVTAAAILEWTAERRTKA